MFVALSSFFRPGVLARTGSLMILSIVALGAFVSPVTVSVGSIGDGVSIVASVSGGEVWAEVWTSLLPLAQRQALDEATKTSPGSTPADKDDIWKTILSLLNGLTNVFFSLLTPLLMLAGWLLTPDWVFGEIFGLRPVLHQLWVLVSNIVYIIFAFLLVAMAFMNIFAGEKNTWAIKAKLPKLIVWVISVPFTWFFVSAIVSISSILTASAIQLAGDLTPNNSASPKITIYKDCTIDFTKWTLGKDKTAKFTDCKNPVETPLSDILKSKDAFGIVSYYAYSIFQIQDLKSVAEGNLKTVKSVLDISVGLLIGIIFFFIMFLIVAALVVSMLMRAFYFWAIAIFSPLLSLRYFFDGKLWGIGDKWLTIPNIIGLAMVPVYVAAALAFGLVFLSAIKNTALNGTESDYVKVENSGDTQTIDAFWTKYTIVGKPVGTTVKNDAIGLGAGFIGTLLIQIAGLAILWFAVMAALKSSEITKEASDPISSFGSEIGWLLKKLPQYAPIIPTSHGSLSMSNLKGVSGGITSAVSTRWSDEANRLWQGIAASMGFAGDKITTAMKNVNVTINPKSLVQGSNSVEAFNRLVTASWAKSVDELARLPASAKWEFSKFVGWLNESLLPKAKQEAISKWLLSSSPAEITTAYTELQNILAGGGHLRADQTVVNTALVKLQEGKTSSTPQSNVPITVKPQVIELKLGNAGTFQLDMKQIPGRSDLPNFSNQAALVEKIKNNMSNGDKQLYIDEIKAKLRWQVGEDSINDLLKELKLTP